MRIMASKNSSRKSSPPPLSHADIAKRARALWESRGQPAGQDEAIWLEAESQLSPPSSTTGMLRASGWPDLNEPGDARGSDRGAEISARKNQRDQDDDRDI